MVCDDEYLPGKTIIMKLVRCLYWYLPNGHANVVRYDDLVSNCRLWYPKCVSIIDMYFTLLSLGGISFNVGPLWMGLISTWYILAGSKHNLTLPFALGTNRKLLHHYTNSSIPRGLMMSIFCRHSSSSLKVFVMHMPHTLVHLMQFAVWLKL